MDALVPERKGDDLLVTLGGEFSLMQILFARLGLLIPENSDVSVVVAGGGLAVPAKHFDVRLDFAVFPLEIVGGNTDVGNRDQRASLSLNVPLPLGSSASAAER